MSQLYPPPSELMRYCRNCGADLGVAGPGSWLCADCELVPRRAMKPVFPPNRVIREGDSTPTPMTPHVHVGDRMRLSVELMQDIHERPEHVSELVELVEIRVEADGSKVLVVKRCEP